MKFMLVSNIAVATLICAIGTNGQSFDPLRHLGGNGQWFPGPNVYGIDPAAPEGCTIDQAAFVSRHGSRYPDQSAYQQWTDLHAKIQAASFTTNTSTLRFLNTWKPVLTDPASQISQLSPTGQRELYSMGVAYRLAYPSLYPTLSNSTLHNSTTPYPIFANLYAPSPRVLNSAQLFARGYLGPSSPFPSHILVLNGSDPRSLANSLSPSDLCPAYTDNGGGPEKSMWDSIWLPPATARINALLKGNLTFSTADVGIFAYLCGFETQIVGERSPWCGVLREEEVRAYEYAQDLRYYWGAGPGNKVAGVAMAPFLRGVVRRFEGGPGRSYVDSRGERWVPPALEGSFANDGQIAQLVAAAGVFDGQMALGGEGVDMNRTYRASNFVTMRGTVGFERLNCAEKRLFIRIKLNDAVYPVASCQDGPGRSCGLERYGAIVAEKLNEVGGFRKACNVTDNTVPDGKEATTFLWDDALPFIEAKAI